MIRSSSAIVAARRSAIARATRDMHGGNGIQIEYHVMRHAQNPENVRFRGLRGACARSSAAPEPAAGLLRPMSPSARGPPASSSSRASSLARRSRPAASADLGSPKRDRGREPGGGKHTRRWGPPFIEHGGEHGCLSSTPAIAASAPVSPSFYRRGVSAADLAAAASPSPRRCGHRNFEARRPIEAGDLRLFGAFQGARHARASCSIAGFGQGRPTCGAGRLRRFLIRGASGIAAGP